MNDTDRFDPRHPHCQRCSRHLLLLCWLCATLSGFGQTFLAEWTASSSGGVAPVGLALATEAGVNYLYVTDAPRGRVLKFNLATGEVAATIGGPGTGNGQFSQPAGIAVHAATGDLYIVDRGNNRVQRITNAGGFVMAWGSAGSAAGQFNDPFGVAVDAAGDVYVTDRGNNRVQKFSVAQSGGTWTATPLAAWGSAGAATGQFNSPYGIVVDNNGTVWVADGTNGRVQSFTTAGVFQSVVGGPGTGPGQFVIATGVSVDPAGGLVVTSTNTDPTNGALADAANQWVSRFSAAGAFVSRWGGAFGSGPGQLRLPFSAVVSSANRAYVADFYNNRIQVFDLSAGGTPPPATTTGPVITSFTLGPNPTTTSATFVVTFNEPVTGVDATDFAINAIGGASANITGVTQGDTAAAYNVAFNYSGSAGSIQMAIRTAGTGITSATSGEFIGRGIAASAVVPVNNAPPADATPPALTTFVAGTASGLVVNFTATFNEPVTGLDAADFLVTRTGTATATIGAVADQAGGAVYTIPITFGGEGTVQLTLIGGATTNVRDAATHWFAGGNSAVSTVFTLSGGGGGGPDTTPPTVATFTIGDATATSVTFNLTFTEPVTGVDAADFSVATTGGATATIGTVGGSGTAYTIPVTFGGTGTVQLSLNASGTGIVDVANNAIAAGAASPVFTISSGGGGSGGSGGGGTVGTQLVSITPPPNGVYRKGDELIFVLHFSGPVVLRPEPAARADDDDSDGGMFFTWTAVGTTDPKRDSGKVHYRSGNGTNALTFRYKVRNGDVAPQGILLSTQLHIDDGATIGGQVAGQSIALVWAQNPLTGVILDAPKLNNGNQGNGSAGTAGPSGSITSSNPSSAPSANTPGPSPSGGGNQGNANGNGSGNGGGGTAAVPSGNATNTNPPPASPANTSGPSQAGGGNNGQGGNDNKNDPSKGNSGKDDKGKDDKGKDPKKGG